MPEDHVEKRLNGKTRRGWLLAFRDITGNSSERTAIFSLLPKVAVGHTAPLVFLNGVQGTPLVLCFLACTNSLVFDYVARQKMGGAHLTYGVLSQLPMPVPSSFTNEDIEYINERVLELIYTAWDMQPFAEDLWSELDNVDRERVLTRWEDCCREPISNNNILPPFRWSEERRAHIRAELDAYIAKIYGLTRDELRYILDPADVYGQDFPGETFRVLKTKEIKLFGEYRTKRLVLEKWDVEQSRQNS
jgi:hypothetical protein